MEYMGFWIRLAAAVIDGVLVSIVNFVVVNLVVGLTFGLGDGLMRFFLSQAIFWIYNVAFIAAKGQTLGKMALGIQVVDNQGRIPGIGSILLREVVGKTLSAFAVGLGYLWVAWDREKRGWHDHIAGTYVVRKRSGNLGEA